MRKVLRRAAFAIACGALLIYLLFPFYYAILTSLKSGAEIFRVDYWPPSLDLSNYAQVMEQQPFGRNILNSVIVATCSVAISLALGVSAAYSLARVRFRGGASCSIPFWACRCFRRSPCCRACST